MLLAGDIGGTKTRLALFSGIRKIIYEEKFVSHEFTNLSHIVKIFLSKRKVSPKKACFAVAGPVHNGKCQATNLPWLIDAKKLAKDLKISSVFLINDLESVGYGIPSLNSKELFCLNKGKARGGNAAIVAAGTGLGEAGLYWDGKKHHPFPSEGGHTDFGARTEVEMELYRYLKKKYPHISYERIVSGPGIHNIYKFLIAMRLEKEKPEIRARILKEDPPRVITEAAMKNECAACMHAVDWFISLYGAEAGNVALKFLALGGIYIGGGIAPKIVKEMPDLPKLFMRSFLDKGRFAPLLSEVPVHVILNENIGLFGAANYARTHR